MFLFMIVEIKLGLYHVRSCLVEGVIHLWGKNLSLVQAVLNALMFVVFNRIQSLFGFERVQFLLNACFDWFGSLF
jgi:hypothetical protein